MAGLTMIDAAGVVITAVAGVCMSTGVLLYELEGENIEYALRVVTVGGVWSELWRAAVGVRA